MNKLTPQEIKLMSPLGLAYIGDCIYELMTRERIVSRGNMPVSKLHRETVSIVCAARSPQQSIRFWHSFPRRSLPFTKEGETPTAAMSQRMRILRSTDGQRA